MWLHVPCEFCRSAAEVEGSTSGCTLPHGQPAGEHRDPLRLVSPEVALVVWEALRDTTWVDRLRLLGNGVVPAQAAAAWRFLWRHLEERQG